MSVEGLTEGTYRYEDIPSRLLARALGGKGLGAVLGAKNVKGLEPAGFEPRVLKGMALAYAAGRLGRQGHDPGESRSLPGDVKKRAKPARTLPSGHDGENRAIC
jgi:aldehyde:ferredoxin oxidoreductase